MALPAAWPAVALLLGVLAGVGRSAGPGPAAGALIFLAWAVAAACLAQRAGRLFVATSLAAFLFCGWALGALGSHAAARPPLRSALEHLPGAHVLTDAPAEPVWLTGRLAQDVLPEGGAARMALDVSTVGYGGQLTRTNGRVLLSVSGAVSAEATEPWRQGRLVQVPALLRRPARYLNPGVADGEAALARRGVALVGTVKSPLLVELLAPAGQAGELGGRLRDWARRTLGEHVGRHDLRSAAIARAVLLGDRAGLDDETTERLQQAGTYHVIAISGGNIAILTALLMWTFRVVRVGRPAAELSSVLVLGAYAWFVGGGPSVARATLMAATYLIARAIDLRSPPANALAVAGGIVLVMSPMAVFDPGTWLTFGATLSILLIVGGVMPRLGLRRWWSRAAAGLLLASAAAELALFPVSAFAFSRVTAAGLAANFAAVPLMSLVQTAGTATLLAAPVCPDIAAAGGQITHYGAWALVESARLVDAMPWTNARVPAPGWPAMAAYYGAWLVLGPFVLEAGGSGGTRLLRSGLRRPPAVLAWGAAGVVAASSVWMLTAPHGGRPGPGRLRVTWIDVGQGDATLVDVPGGKTVLIDAGGAGGSAFDIGRRVIAPVLWARGVRRLDYLAMTHPDGDHLSGAAVLVRDFGPTEIWEGIPVGHDGALATLRQAAAGVGATWRNVQRGDRTLIGDVEFIVWHPPLGDWERQRVRNDDSILVEVRYRDVSIVLPGDIEAASEADVAALIGPSRLRVAQAAHHGSASSTTAAWLDAAAPRLAVVSAGRGNPYGHPHAAVLSRYRERSIPVFRTDLDGAVTLETDGATVWVRSFSGRRLTIGPGVSRRPAP